MDRVVVRVQVLVDLEGHLALFDQVRVERVQEVLLVLFASRPLDPVFWFPVLPVGIVELTFLTLGCLRMS